MAISYFSNNLQAWCCPEFCTLDYFCRDAGYFSVTGGATHMRDMHIRVRETIGDVPLFALHTDYKIGYGVGVALGAAMQAWRFEVEAYYRKNEGAQFSVVDFTTTPASEAVFPTPFYYRSFSIMTNAYYQFCLWQCLDLYLGIGVGPSWVRFQAIQPIGGVNTKFAIDNIRFSYQGMAGLKWTLPCNLHLTVGYRAWAALKQTGKPGNLPDGTSIRLSEEHEPVVQSLELSLEIVF